jgi:hypothetical protein
MRFFKYYVLIALSTVATVQAAPTAISAVRVTPATKVYTFFTFDAKKLAKLGLFVSDEIAKLTQQLASTNPAVASITPCEVPGDLNFTQLSCGNGEIRFGDRELYTFNTGFNIPAVGVRLDNGVHQEYGINFLAPNNLFPGDGAGRVVRVQFKQRMAQFSLLIDTNTGTSNGIQFIVNHQSTPVRPLPAAGVTFVGVEDSDGFTDVTIITSGGSRQWYSDRFSYLPLANF